MCPFRPRTIDFRELEGLPAPVGRYFRAVLEEGRPMEAGVRVRHTGTFNMGESTDQWRASVSDQKVVTQRPGFDWNGRVKMMIGLPALVHDAYVAGEGVLHASVLGLFPVVQMRNAGDVAEGELMRFFVEAAWYPTALLPSQGVRWEARDDHSAQATLTEGDISITMLFTFDEQGLVDTVRAEAAAGRWAARSSPPPGTDASGTTTSAVVCGCRLTARWPGCCPRARSHTGAVASPRSATKPRGDRRSIPTGAWPLGNRLIYGRKRFGFRELSAGEARTSTSRNFVRVT